MAVKARADENAIAPPSEAQAHVRMRKAFHQLRENDDQHELRGRDTNQLRHDHEDGIAQDAIEQMDAVVAPHGHLALAVMHRVQRPEPVKSMLGAMVEIIHRIENQQIDDEAHPGLIRHAGPHLVNLQRR